jgi:hypothetical protein
LIAELLFLPAVWYKYSRFFRDKNLVEDTRKNIMTQRHVQLNLNDGVKRLNIFKQKNLVLPGAEVIIDGISYTMSKDGVNWDTKRK